MIGAQALIQTLVDSGAHVALHGTGYLRDALRGSAGRGAADPPVPPFEGAVTGTADGYARATGKPR